MKLIVMIFLVTLVVGFAGYKLFSPTNEITSCDDIKKIKVEDKDKYKELISKCLRKGEFKKSEKQSW
ncbi:TPA: entry exclusion lipoprotein TrbK [Yersinia enterocolitica]|nr:entry exclusion lipoprotein TrbK [Yersinia enterocolitica]HDL7609411.1 entry exclusion lipoprotein TrbK [Yersinia enterocolitica]HDL7617607.1 entry exclusion lipoprotein TrbK [Yersinia enterocolitica]HDL7675894.1 entry exclusion lipoprotein TrbK [Yersinia enterocolitica]HDL7705654.1 entry exclusion lipoprotein TrbK [Yersinia enterocolitica]